MGETAKSKKRKTRIIIGMAVLIIVPSAIGFTEKFIQFVRTLSSDDGGHFTVIPILNYLIVTAGFTCLLVWATAHGMFRDVEKPKFKLLEQEEELNRQLSGVISGEKE